MSKNIEAAVAALKAERDEMAKKLEPLDKMIAHLEKQLPPKPKKKEEEKTA
jgi:hypothetical protein